MLRTLAVFVLILTMAAGVFAQSDANKGQIAGTVLDPNQAVVPNAKVKVQNTGTGLVRELSSGSDGVFRAILLDADTYDVTVDAPGFATSVLKGVVVNVGTPVDLSVTLQVGSTTQTIEVSAPLLSTEMPSPSTVVNLGAIRDLPINGRRFQDFATLTPTVSVDPERGQLSYVGQRGINSNVMVDGADYNNPFFGGIRGGERSNFVPTVPQSSIQEFQAVVAGYTAEYGRSSGGLLNVITKSGANDVHGDAFYQIRHKETGLETPFKRQVLETLQQFGGSVGGPVIHDKLFWFGAIERQQSKTPRQIVFGPLIGFAADATTKEAFDFYNGLQGVIPSTNNATALTARGDYQFRGGSRLTLRYNFGDATANNAITTGGLPPAISNRSFATEGAEKDRTNTGVAQLTSVLTPAMTNDLRYSESFELRPRTSNSTLPSLTNSIGSYGARNFLPTTQDDERTQIADTLSMVHGAHTFKAGVDYDYLTTGQFFGFNQFGSISTNVGSVTQILEDLSLGGPTANRFDNPLVTYNRQIGNLLTQFNMHQIAFFGQDSWRVTRKLSIDLGLRWEGQKNPQPDANNTAVISTIKGLRFPNGDTFDPATTPNAYNQVMPRFGFAFTPSDSKRTVIRGHAGIFYAATPMIVFAPGTNNFRVPAGDLSILVGGASSKLTVYQAFKAAGVDLNTFPLDKLPVLTIDQATQAAAASSGTTPNPFSGASFAGTANDFLNPRSIQAGFGTEHSITNDWVAGVQFNYVNTVHLERNRDYNLPAPTIRAIDGRAIFNRANRPLPQYGNITIKESSARSMYRGVTFNTRYRGKRFQAGGAYTLSETFSDDDNERTATGFTYQNSFNLKDEYSYSRLDARHSTSGFGLVNLPWGMTVSLTFRAHSGLPFDPSADSDLNGDGNSALPGGATGTGASDRPYQSVGVPFGRNSFRNRMFKDVDLRFLKTFKFGERTRLEFSTEMFNLFNWDNVVYDGNNLIYGPGISPTTGAVVAPNATFRQLKLPNGIFDPTNSQVGTPFQAQFGLRLFF